MHLNESEGILVRSFPSGNDALVIRVISKDFGKIVLYAAHAKKSKKRFGKLDLFDWGNFSYQAKQHGLSSLNHFNSKSSFPEIRDSYQRIVCAAHLAEIFDILTPEEDPNSSEHFVLLLHTLQALTNCEDSKDSLRVTHNSIFKLLEITGEHPPEDLKQASAKKLKNLINQVEHTCEKQLDSKADMLDLIQSIN